MHEEAARRVAENPFLVLGLTPAATRAKVERQASKLLAMLQVGLKAARTYETPFGPLPRDTDLVRAAVETLRNDADRPLHASWYLPPEPRLSTRAPPPGVPSARRLFGWG